MPATRAARPSQVALLMLAALLAPSTAGALPGEGEPLPEVKVERTDGSQRALPDRTRAVLVVYEDKDAGAQNQHLRTLLHQAGRDRNHAAVEVVAVGDVSAFDF